ncbi:2OG-Fe dioxygenase family protein [Clavibacter sp. VKM Ac-2873]|uniref:2OG-Fe dioxygenase family protein n=1 Tax=Clavibacter sp. VKM Ac-2873 TaxID=2783813 RepID=UPI00188D9773|nr:2OG-Fe dioxygenase family protein [Clavibacter sp. VKM Ac-2873]MBF4617845.1 2OG-Fe dioxygenase family protein [Clavibacter sp. VKM Ac-2873]
MDRQNAIDELVALRGEYLRDRAIFVPGGRLIPILRALGAQESDFAALRQTSEGLVGDPTLPFRRTRNGRFAFDLANSRIKRLEPQPFVLSAAEDFIRHDSGKPRVFDPIGLELQDNTVMQALLRFKCLIVRDTRVEPRPHFDYDHDLWICTLFNIRTVTVPRLRGEPSLEGVHSDGVDHTMTTFLGSENITTASGVTYMHDMTETTGIPWEQADPQRVRGSVRHQEFLDTLVLVDHERKHSVSSVYAEDPDAVAKRDMLIFFTRKPVVAGHVSKPFDSTREHDEEPLSLQIPVDLTEPSLPREAKWESAPTGPVPTALR